MEQKRVSFKVARAIKEAGYPQEWNDCEYYYTENGELKRSDDYEGNSIEDIMYNQRYAIPAPTYLDVWLWQWQKKQIDIYVTYIEDMKIFNCESEKLCRTLSVAARDPEEAIIAAIDYLVDNDLMK